MFFKCNTHLECAKMCKDVYNDKKEIIVKKKYGKMFIAMEGTDNIKDWINNLSFMFKKNDKHSGFTRYANHCKEQYNIKFFQSINHLLVIHFLIYNDFLNY